MTREKLCALVAAGLASGMLASTSLATDYNPTKDTYFVNSSATIMGSNLTGRGARDINLAFYLSDFDRAAITAEIRSISGNLFNPLTLADVATVKVHWMLRMNLGAEGEDVATNQLYLDARYGITDLQTQTGANWTEAGANDLTDGNGNQWKDRTGNPLTSVANIWHLRDDQKDPLTAWGGTAPSDGSDAPYRDWILSDALVFDYLTNADFAGLALIGDTSNPTKMEVWSREAAAGSQPFLSVVAVVPEPASLSLLGLGGLLLVRTRRKA